MKMLYFPGAHSAVCVRQNQNHSPQNTAGKLTIFLLDTFLSSVKC